MTEASHQRDRIRILAANLVLLMLCAGGLFVILLAYLFLRKNIMPASTALTPTLKPSFTLSLPPTTTLTPSITPTPRPTSTSTITLSPTWSQTPSSTFTMTPYPSLTPALALAFEGAYKLDDWDANKSDYLVKLMQGYAAGIASKSSLPNDPAILDAYSYPIFAIREALLRFPEAPQAEEWRWTLAYDLSLIGDPAAGEIYAQIIADNLNRSQVSIPELYAWFKIHEPRLDLYMVAVNIPPGYLGSYLVELRGSGGSSFIWLLDKTPAYQAYPLLTNFDFAEPRKANWLLADLDNQIANGEEVAIYFSNLVGETELQPPWVFRLNKIEPVQLPFIPPKDIFQLGMDFDSKWLLNTDTSRENELLFKAMINPSCPLQIELSYKWNGLYFKPAESHLYFPDLPADLAPCEPLIDHAIHYWSPQVAVSLMETILPFWPPAEDLEGNPFPADEMDEFRYRLGVYKALSEDFDGAVATLNSILTDPAINTSRWIDYARDFLADYQKPEDIYRSCKNSPYCDPSIAIEILASNIPSQLDAMRYLREWGMEPISSGYFDFEDDDESERWFTVRSSPQQKLDFWILVRDGGTYDPLWVSTVDSRIPTISRIEEPYIADEGLSLQPAVLLDGIKPFSIKRVTDTREPYLMDVPLRETYPSQFLVPLESYKEGLFQGSSPEVIQKSLENMKEYPGLLCESTWICDEYYYLLGLASELAMDSDTAADAFQYLWLNYSKSPFTAMARIKLVPVGTLIAPSMTPTITPSITTSITPPTGTVSPSPTASGTPTPTFTVTGTPPTATPTRTPTTPPQPIPPTSTQDGYPPIEPYPTLPYP